MRPKLINTLIITIIVISAFMLSNYTHFISANVLALLFGMILNGFLSKKHHSKEISNFFTKHILKVSIILLGVSLNISQVLYAGKYSLIVMFFTLISAYALGSIFGKLLGIKRNMSTLIATGTGICGGSAIVALAPVIKADNSDITFAIAATFLFDIVMILVFPYLGHLLGFSDIAFGLWTGTAVNDTSSVIATAFAFSDTAGEFAIIVKLTRTLSLIPIIILFSFMQKKDTFKSNSKQYIMKSFPWFILGFLVSVTLNSTGVLSDLSITILQMTGKILMATALAAIGLRTDIKTLFKSGLHPLTLGLIVSVGVVLVSLLVQVFIGIV